VVLTVSTITEATLRIMLLLVAWFVIGQRAVYQWLFGRRGSTVS